MTEPSVRRPIELDAIDRRILHLLQADGRMTNAALAEAVGLTPTPMLAATLAVVRARELSDVGRVVQALS